MLNYNIRAPLAPSISPGIYGLTGQGGFSRMVPELRSWIQFLSITHFLPLRAIIPTYLVWLVHTWPERAATTRTQEGECWTIA
jgi:hypothetical protein